VIRQTGHCPRRMAIMATARNGGRGVTLRDQNGGSAQVVGSLLT
jgi:hypothetical protein